LLVLERLVEYLDETDLRRMSSHHVYAMPLDERVPVPDVAIALRSRTEETGKAGAFGAEELIPSLQEEARRARAIATRWHVIAYANLAAAADREAAIALLEVLRRDLPGTPIDLVASLTMAEDPAAGNDGGREASRGCFETLRSIASRTDSDLQVVLVDDAGAHGEGVRLGREEVVVSQALTGCGLAALALQGARPGARGARTRVADGVGFVSAGAAACLYPRIEIARRLALQEVSDVLALLAESLSPASDEAPADRTHDPPHLAVNSALSRLRGEFGLEPVRSRLGSIVGSHAWDRMFQHYGRERILRRRYWLWSSALREMVAWIEQVIVSRFPADLSDAAYAETQRFGRAIDRDLDKLFGLAGDARVSLRATRGVADLLEGVDGFLAEDGDRAAVEDGENRQKCDAEIDQRKRALEESLAAIEHAARRVTSTASLLVASVLAGLGSLLVAGALVPDAGTPAALVRWAWIAGSLAAASIAAMWIDGRWFKVGAVVSALDHAIVEIAAYYRALEARHRSEGLLLVLNGFRQWLRWSFYPKRYSATDFPEPRLDLDRLARRFEETFGFKSSRTDLEALPLSFRAVSRFLRHSALAMRSPHSLLERRYPARMDDDTLARELIAIAPNDRSSDASRERRLCAVIARFESGSGEEARSPLAAEDPGATPALRAFFGSVGSPVDWRRWAEALPSLLDLEQRARVAQTGDAASRAAVDQELARMLVPRATAEGGAVAIVLSRTAELVEAEAAHLRDSLLMGTGIWDRIGTAASDVEDVFGWLQAASIARVPVERASLSETSRSGTMWILSAASDPLVARCSSGGIWPLGARRTLIAVRYSTGITLRSMLSAPDSARPENRFSRAGITPADLEGAGTADPPSAPRPAAGPEGIAREEGPSS
jgi:hypothetical protein